MNPIFNGEIKAFQDAYSTVSLRETDLKCVSCDGYSHEFLVVPKDQIGLTGVGSYRVIRCLNCIFFGPYYVRFEGEKPIEITPPEEFQCHDFLDGVSKEDCLASIQWSPGLPRNDFDDGWSNRAGGKPVWLQGGEWPVCPLCWRTMQFILQFASCSIISIEYYATLYFFACDTCGVTCSVTQCT